MPCSITADLRRHYQTAEGSSPPRRPHRRPLGHDAIEDAGQSHGSIAHRFGGTVADIVQDCTDPGKHDADGNAAEWFHWKRLYLDSLVRKPDGSLLVTAADKAYNAWDHLLDSHRDPTCWLRARAGLEASACYFQRLEQELKGRLPGSRSVERLGGAVEGILALPEFLRLLPRGADPIEWVLAYELRLAAIHGTALPQAREDGGEGSGDEGHPAGEGLAHGDHGVCATMALPLRDRA